MMDSQLSFMKYLFDKTYFVNEKYRINFIY